MSVQFLLDEDAARLVDSGPASQEEKADDDFQRALVALRGSDLAAAISCFRLASEKNQDVILKLWDGLYHEIHNEPEQAEVFKVMIAWLDKHL